MSLRVAILRAYTGAFRAASGFLARRLRSNFYLYLAGLFSLFALFDVLVLHQVVDMRQRSYDLVIKNRIVKPAADPDIVIVDIDERSLAAMAPEYGRWPWPRQVLAEFVENAARQGPSAIVLDVLFSDPDVFNPDSDAYFNEVIAATPGVFFPYLRLPQKNDALSELAPQAIPGAVRTPLAREGATVAVVLPHFPAALQAGRLGTFNVEPDADGVVRRYPVWLDAYGWQLPSLPLVVGQALGHPAPARQSILLNWRGKPFSYRYASFSDVYLDMLNSDRKRPPEEFKGKIVLVGSTAAGLGDIKGTSIDRQFPGVEILATAIDNIRHDDFIRVPTSRWPYFLVAMAILWATAIAFYRNVEPDLFARVFGLSQIGLLVLSYLSINFTNFFFNLTGPVFLAFVYFSIAKVYALATARALERNPVAESLRGVGSHQAAMAVVQIAGRDDTSTAIFMRALKKAVERHGKVPKDVEVIKGKQRGVFGLLESTLVVSWVHVRDDVKQAEAVEADVAALGRDLDRLVAAHAIAGERLASLHVHRRSLGGAAGRVLPGEWRLLFGEALAAAEARAQTQQGERT
ncbi:MAG: CHASE2 domain-containing protein [Burkholderiales bacterium]|nr:CHASE2 domain-containing protein [Burkholderiales bacterium]